MKNTGNLPVHLSVQGGYQSHPDWHLPVTSLYTSVTFWYTSIPEGYRSLPVSYCKIQTQPSLWIQFYLQQELVFFYQKTVFSVSLRLNIDLISSYNCITQQLKKCLPVAPWKCTGELHEAYRRVTRVYGRVTGSYGRATGAYRRAIGSDIRNIEQSMCNLS